MILSTTELLGRGYTPAGIRRDLRARQLHRVVRGRYTVTDPTTMTPEQRHRLLIEATVDLAEDPILSHASAGVLHGLWLPASALHRMHLTRPVAKDSLGRWVHVHPPAGELRTVRLPLLAGQVKVTDLTTTTVSLLRTLPIIDAVAVADSALRRGLDPERARSLLRSQRRWPGVRRAALVLDFADARSESAGESRSRWLMRVGGVPAPVLQQEFRTPDGQWIGRCDFWWPEAGLIGEFDGRIKYGRLLGPGQQLEDVVLAERRREVALINLGHRITRWTWATLMTPGALAEQLQRAMRRR